MSAARLARKRRREHDRMLRVGVWMIVGGSLALAIWLAVTGWPT